MARLLLGIGLLIFSLGLAAGPAAAQEGKADKGAPTRTIAADGTIEIHQPGGGVKRIVPTEAGTLPESLDPGQLFLEDLSRQDPSVRAKQVEAAREYYAYKTQGYRHRRRVFEWQLLSERIIFVAVLVVVLAGLYFAAVQFHIGLRRRGAAPAVTEISASAEGIKVSSPVLGVIILTLSLAFFYLYLVYVYPISEIF
jgi:hypothetical protein